MLLANIDTANWLVSELAEEFWDEEQFRIIQIGFTFVEVQDALRAIDKSGRLNTDGVVTIKKPGTSVGMRFIKYAMNYGHPDPRIYFVHDPPTESEISWEKSLRDGGSYREFRD